MAGRPPVLPDREGLARLRRRHHKDKCPIRGCRGRKHTYQEISDGFGVSYSAVYHAMRKYGLTDEGSRVDHRDTIPWTLRPEHKYKPTAMNLRLLGQIRRGDPVEPEKRRMVIKWLTELIEQRMVIDYDREQGWLRVPWEPGDADVIRPPDDADPEVYSHPALQAIWSKTALSPVRRRKLIAEAQAKIGRGGVPEVLRKDRSHWLPLS